MVIKRSASQNFRGVTEREARLIFRNIETINQWLDAINDDTIRQHVEQQVLAMSRQQRREFEAHLGEVEDDEDEPDDDQPQNGPQQPQAPGRAPTGPQAPQTPPPPRTLRERVRESWDHGALKSAATGFGAIGIPAIAMHAAKVAGVNPALTLGFPGGGALLGYLLARNIPGGRPGVGASLGLALGTVPLLTGLPASAVAGGVTYGTPLGGLLLGRWLGRRLSDVPLRLFPGAAGTAQLRRIFNLSDWPVPLLHNATWGGAIGGAAGAYGGYWLANNVLASALAGFSLPAGTISASALAYLGLPVAAGSVGLYGLGRLHNAMYGWQHGSALNTMWRGLTLLPHVAYSAVDKTMNHVLGFGPKEVVGAPVKAGLWVTSRPKAILHAGKDVITHSADAVRLGVSEAGSMVGDTLRLTALRGSKSAPASSWLGKKVQATRDGIWSGFTGMFRKEDGSIGIHDAGAGNGHGGH